MQNRTRKSIRARDDRQLQKVVFSRYNRTEAYMNSQDPHRFKLDKIPGWRRENGFKVPKLRSLLQLIPLGKEKVSFLQRIVTGFINHILGQALYPRTVGQYQVNMIEFVCVCVVWCALEHIHLLLYFILVFIILFGS